MGLIATIIQIYTFVMIASVVVSWLSVPRDNPVIKVLDAVTEPVLSPIRKVLPPMGGLDFSPVVVILALQLLRRAII